MRKITLDEIPALQLTTGERIMMPLSKPLDILVVGSTSLFIGAITGMSGTNPGRFAVVTYVESSVPTSVGTTIGITAMVTVSTVMAYLKSGNVYRRAFLTLTTTGVIGCVIASFFTVLLPSLLVLVMVAAAAVWSIYRIAFSRGTYTGDGEVESFDRKQHAKQYTVGLVVGFLSGLIGIIFSNIVLGSLIHVVKSNPKLLIGTTLAFSAVLGACGVFAHLAQGNMNFLLLGIMGSTGVIGGVVGSRFSVSMESRKLKMLIIGTQAGALTYLTFVIVIAILRPAVIHCRSCF